MGGPLRCFQRLEDEDALLLANHRVVVELGELAVQLEDLPLGELRSQHAFPLEDHQLSLLLYR